MNDDLLKRLREPCFERGLDEMWIDDQRNEAADRMEAMQADAETHAALLFYAYGGELDWDKFLKDIADHEAIKRIAELEAQVEKARNDALREAANIANGYGSCACDLEMRDVILALIDKDTNPK